MPEADASGDVVMAGPTGPDQEGVSDMEWLKRRMTEKVDQVDAKVFEQSDDEGEGSKEKVEPVGPSFPPLSR